MMMDSPFPPGSKLWAYARDSGGDRQEASVEQQKAEYHRFCDTHGLALLHIFADVAHTGGTTVGRDQFEAMMDRARQDPRPVDGVLIWSWARWARDFDDAQFFRADLRRRGYTFHSFTDIIPDMPPEDQRMFEAMIDWKNARFRRDLSKDIKRGHRSLLDAGYAPGGAPPAGYKAESHVVGKRRSGEPHVVSRWVPDPEKWDLARRAWQMRIEGATLKEIHRETHLLGSLSSYPVFFNNPIYVGDLQWGDKIYADFVEPLIPREWWEKEQERRQSWTAGAPPRRKRSPYLLSGLAVCAYCGGPMSGSYARGNPHPDGSEYRWPYYLCARMKREGWDTCEGKSISARLVEKTILDIVISQILTPAHILDQLETLNRERAASQSDKTTDIRLKERQLLETQRAINALLDLVELVGASQDAAGRLRQHQTKKLQLETELELLTGRQIQQPIQITESALHLILQEMHALLTSENTKAARDLLSSFITQITLGRDSGHLHYHLPPILISNQSVALKTNIPIAIIEFQYAE